MIYVIIMIYIIINPLHTRNFSLTVIINHLFKWMLLYVCNIKVVESIDNALKMTTRDLMFESLSLYISNYIN